MNFEHFSPATVDEAFTTDCKFNRICNLLNKESGEDQRIMDIIGNNYEVYCEFF
jgi:hypothetical protein